ncbi:MAG: hypothetical protein ACI358_00390 [Candidatus Limimorpha sp.]
MRFLLFALLFGLSSGVLIAQEELTEKQMIPVRVLMPTNSEIKGDALTILYNRLNQAVALNGLGSSTNESRFIIVPSITVVSKSATSSIPVQFLAEVEISLYFVDNVNKVILAQEVITKKAMDNNDSAAVSKAIKSVQARDPKLKKLINIGKNNAVQYYSALESMEEQADGQPDVNWIFE